MEVIGRSTWGVKSHPECQNTWRRCWISRWICWSSLAVFGTTGKKRALFAHRTLALVGLKQGILRPSSPGPTVARSCHPVVQPPFPDWTRGPEDRCILKSNQPESRTTSCFIGFYTTKPERSHVKNGPLDFQGICVYEKLGPGWSNTPPHGGRNTHRAGPKNMPVGRSASDQGCFDPWPMAIRP